MTQILNLSDIEKNLENADENTLVIFDVDDVLITTEDHFIHPYAEKVTERIFNRNFDKPSDKKKLDEIVSLCFLLPKRILVEETTPSLIQRLKEKKIKVIALTACPSGNLGVIDKVEEWRVEDLRSFGIDFSSSFPKNQRIVLEGLKSESAPSPIFEQGILFSYGFKKGDVLKEFLKSIDFSPSQVLFIDDLSHNLESIQEKMESEKIPHSVFHYKGASRHYRQIDESLIEYQINYLINHRKWLNDSEVRKILKRS